MKNVVIHAPGNTPVICCARRELVRLGGTVTAEPGDGVTHLLLPAPAFEPDGRIRGGGILEHILSDLPEGIPVIGGNLQHPALEGRERIDLLMDGLYLARNAAITADCAIRAAAQKLQVVFDGCPVLILGWGRIGKSLSAQLKAMGAKVAVAARKPSDRYTLEALGYEALDIGQLNTELGAFRLIYNTVPQRVLTRAQLEHCRRDCVKIELASRPGMEGDGILTALGLPGKMAPESSGILIARTVLRLLKEKEETI